MKMGVIQFTVLFVMSCLIFKIGGAPFFPSQSPTSEHANMENNSIEIKPIPIPLFRDLFPPRIYFRSDPFRYMPEDTNKTNQMKASDSSLAKDSEVQNVTGVVKTNTSFPKVENRSERVMYVTTGDSVSTFYMSYHTENTVELEKPQLNNSFHSKTDNMTDNTTEVATAVPHHVKKEFMERGDEDPFFISSIPPLDPSNRLRPYRYYQAIHSENHVLYKTGEKEVKQQNTSGIVYVEYVRLNATDDAMRNSTMMEKKTFTVLLIEFLHLTLLFLYGCVFIVTGKLCHYLFSNERSIKISVSNSTSSTTREEKILSAPMVGPYNV